MGMTALAFVLFSAGGEIVRLSPETWDRVPGGKEVDAIAGDYVMRNDKVVAVIGAPVLTRHANLSVRHVQGAVIDFALLETNNDQLSAFYPHGQPAEKKASAGSIRIVKARGPEVLLVAVKEATKEDGLEQTTEYALRDGEAFLRIRTRHRNAGDRPVTVRLSDKIRCDQTFAQDPAGAYESLVFYDKWFLAAYGVVRPGGRIVTDGKFGGMFGANSGTWLDYPDVGKEKTLQPGQDVVLERCLVAGRHAAEVQSVVAGILGRRLSRAEVSVVDPAGRPVPAVDVVVRREKIEASAAFTDAAGRATFALPPGTYTVACTQTGRAPREASLTIDASDATLRIALGPASYASFDVVDEEGRSVPCKVQFVAVEETPPVNLGPKQRSNGCGNLYFAPAGRFSVPIPAGKYYVILSRGPECDAAYRYITVREGETERVRARLPRVVETTGWISADFHNHSTPSGDNTTVVEGRLTCLVAEGVEFAAATEHNRIVTYRDLLQNLGLSEHMATSDGIELTTSPLPLSHHNAFPLVRRPNLQDGGGPPGDPNPLTQIRRLLEHDGHSEKLLQQNHPDIGWLFYDGDGDGSADLGFGTAAFTHVMEIWRPTILDLKPFEPVGANVRNNRVFNWLQLLNQGIRIPGVANTDAHYCIHESGRLRNWVKSSALAPSLIDELEVVRQARKGRIVMSNGPFLEVSLEGKGPGDDVKLEGGKGTLRVRVECPNWLEVDRVQVLVNGRPDPALNFTRTANREKFRDGVVKFREEIPLELGADAHLIVVAIGESGTLGPVMGQMTEPPVAIANPIFADVDGEGFVPNKDTLDAPLPVKKEPPR